MAYNNLVVYDYDRKAISIMKIVKFGIAGVLMLLLIGAFFLKSTPSNTTSLKPGIDFGWWPDWEYAELPHEISSSKDGIQVTIFDEKNENVQQIFMVDDQPWILDEQTVLCLIEGKLMQATRVEQSMWEEHLAPPH